MKSLMGDHEAFLFVRIELVLDFSEILESRLFVVLSMSMSMSMSMFSFA